MDTGKNDSINFVFPVEITKILLAARIDFVNNFCVFGQ